MDEKYWQELKNGNSLALESIYSEHVDSLYRYGLRIDQDENKVMDHIQDLFIYLWEHRTSLGTTTSIRAYLMRSLRNKMIDSYRKEARDRNKVHSLQYSEDDSPEDTIISDETQQKHNLQLAQALAKLSDKQREIIHLKYIENMSYEDISELLQINYQSARNLIHRSIVEMRKYMTFLFALIFTS
jgi:RNA polymerase sigma factor (sigma-70 family)